MSSAPIHFQVVNKTLADYIKKGYAQTNKREKIVYIQGLFDYLSTAEVKPLLADYPGYVHFRNTIINKIHEYSTDSYLVAHRQEYHRLFTVFRELFTYLVQDDSVPLRRSERQKQRAVERFNTHIANAPAAEVQVEAPVPVSITVKVLPLRRSERQKQRAAEKRNEPIANAPAAEVQVEAAKPVNIKVKVLPRRSARLMNKL